MIESLKALLADWKDTRSITLTFLNELNDADLDKILPRKKLNTIRLQAYELTLGQRGYVDALTTKTVVFGDEFILFSKEEVLEQKLFGYGIQHKMAEGFLGDYLAISINKMSIDNIKPKDREPFKAGHAGLTVDEMLVPLIIKEIPYSTGFLSNL